ncbi:CBM96 family carbohydrate-binding protein [Dactylosporangium sp. CS-033363]|uniref:CBM96 family carbohydrate-binding protein n=1 Tax=Dactylosporangium sp. CS-033363 TaxID=3239935 RepID=UPI003D8E349F
MQIRQRRGRPRLAAALAVALALPAAAVTFAAPAGAAPAGPPPGSEAAATAQAKAGGKAVAVESARTAYSETLANPDGSFTFTSSARPLHGWNGQAWAAPDATLRAGADGTLSPAAAASGLRLSGGGTGPLAVFDDRAGHLMSVALPMALPKPSLDGATAVYANVLGGVDLRVTATVDGGITEVLVVRDATAAADPALAELRLSTKLTGLRMAADSRTQAVNAVDAATGRSVFAAPPPLMWDSARPATVRGQSLLNAETAAPAGDERPAASTDRGPGRMAQVTAVPLRTDGSAITLAPPAAALRGADVTYPLYIDPAIAPITSPQAYVQSFHTTSVEYNPGDNLRVGFSDWPDAKGYKPGKTRSYLHFGQISSLAGKQIQDAQIQLIQTSSSCTGSFTLKAATTNDFGPNINWDNQPGIGGSPSDSITVNGTNGGYQIPATNIATNARDQGWPTVSVALFMTNEDDHCGYRKLALNPALVVTYWSQPNQPTGLSANNGGQSYPCNTTAPGTRIPAAANHQLTLDYTVSSPDTGGDSLYANAWVGVDGGSPASIVTVIPYSGGNYTVHDPITVADGKRYAWYAQADNTHLWSPTTATCYFQYDATAPGAPAVSSTAYPAQGPSTVTAGNSGNLTLAATDGGTNPSGVAAFQYNVNGTSVTSGGSGQQSVAAAGGTATIGVALAALHWGTNTVWAQTVDAAGNVSQPVHYDFFVQQSAFGPYTPGTAGDIDGDNKPDLTTVDIAGNVRLYTNPDVVPVLPTGNTTVDPLQYGGRVLLPYNQDTLWPSGTFAGAIVAHAGSFSGKNADDLLLMQNGRLAVAQNAAGNGTTWTMTSAIDRPACSGCSGYNADDWSAVRQMIAVPPTTPGGRPSMMTLEFWQDNMQLWLYTPTSGAIGFNAPTRIAGNYSDWAWEQAQLLGAGPFPGLAGTTLLIRGIGTGNVTALENATVPLTGSPATTNRQIIGGGFYQSSAAMSTAGRVDPQGHWALMSIGVDGNLGVFDATSNGTTTTFAPGRVIAASAWTTHQVAIGSSYTPPNKVGVETDGQTTVDPLFPGYNYSGTALATAAIGSGAESSCPWGSCQPGLMAGYSVSVGGENSFTIGGGRSNHYDVWQAIGQTLPAPAAAGGGPAQHISFLGAAATPGDTNATGTATVTFTNGHTQQVQIILTDWAQGSVPQGGNTVVAAMPYRINAATGARDNVPVFIYATADVQLLDNGQPLASGSQIASIKLPDNPAMAIFAVSVY